MRYVRGRGKDENGQARTGDRHELLGGQNFGFPVDTKERLETARRMMEHNNSQEMQGHKSRYVEHGAFHMSLSWARGQTPDRAEQIEACQEFMKALGMEEAMATYHAHHDKSHAHVHVIGSRVNPQTKMTFDDYQQRFKGIRKCVEWEREKNQITRGTQWREDRARAVEQGDYERLQELHLTKEATVRKTNLDLSFAMGGKLGNELEAMREDFVRKQELIRLKEYQNGQVAAYTTKEIWQEERQALANARRLKERAGNAISEDILSKIADEMTLDQEQRDGLWHATRDNGLSLISGEAGTGKSHLQMAIRKAHERSNKKVIGQAFTNKVTQSMQANGFDARTIASELMRLKYGQYRWDKDTVIMPDEAAQISTKDMKEVFRYAERDGAKVIMSGDSKQLGAVDRGGLYSVMERRFGAARLTDVKRNKDEGQKRAFNAMHKRDFAKAVEEFRKSGSIEWDDMKPQSMKRLIEDYTKDWLEDPEATRLIMAGTNEEVAELNKFARDLRRQAGKLGPDHKLDTDKGPLDFAVGDRLSMTETPNKKDKPKGLINGAFGTVKDIRELPNGQKELTFELDRKKDEQRRVFKFSVGMDKEAKEVSGISHGYASTVYKAQGDTIDKTYVQHNPASQATTNYVELSRHSDKVKLYVSREETGGYLDLAAQLQQGRDKTAAHAYQVHEEDRERANQPIKAKEQERGQMNGHDYEKRPPDMVDAARNTAERFKPSNKVGEALDRLLGGKSDKAPEIEESPLSGPKTGPIQKARETYEFMKEIAADVLGMVKSQPAEHTQEHDHGMDMER